jgi:hypothetical protein
MSLPTATAGYVLGPYIGQGEFKFVNPVPNAITLNAGSVEMLKVAPDGFYVRGVKINQDDKEAETVYNAFKAFLMWSELNRR